MPAELYSENNALIGQLQYICTSYFLTGMSTELYHRRITGEHTIQLYAEINVSRTILEDLFVLITGGNYRLIMLLGLIRENRVRQKYIFEELSISNNL